MSDLNKVLELVNKARVALGMSALSELPKGARYDPCDCPLAIALRPSSPPCAVLVDEHAADFPKDEQGQKVADAWGTRNNLGAATLPAPLPEFVLAFDSGQLPQLEN
jgi:hypothetical protein